SKERVERLERVIEEFVLAWSLTPVVRALQTLRGVDLIVAVTFVTEIGDVRRFESPRQPMGEVVRENWTRGISGIPAWGRHEAVSRRDREQTTTPESQSGLQGESGACRDQGREDAGRVGRAV